MVNSSQITTEKLAVLTDWSRARGDLKRSDGDLKSLELTRGQEEAEGAWEENQQPSKARLRPCWKPGLCIWQVRWGRGGGCCLWTEQTSTWEGELGLHWEEGDREQDNTALVQVWAEMDSTLSADRPEC